MIQAFCLTLIVLLACELTKSLSANGTPPILQKFSWQLDLAYFMWSNIVYIRTVCFTMLAILLWLMTSDERSSVMIFGIIMIVLWAIVFYIFTFVWVGKYKFEVLKNPVFKNAADNKIELSEQVMGINWNGVKKAYPVPMIFYHHQVSDTLAEHPIVVTYCGMCQAGRIFDGLVDGAALQLSLVGAITYNAILKDARTGSWWQQETGQAVKGKLKGRQLDDLPMEQMSLKNWLAKNPDSQILQEDSKYVKKYTFLRKLMNYEASFPRWFNQEIPPLVIGIEIDGLSKAYSWNELQKKRLLNDKVGKKPIVVLSSEDGTSPFAYNSILDGQELQFRIEGDVLKDTNTESTWDLFGRCIDGAMKGKELSKVQFYKQFIRAWISFRPDSTFYDFNVQQ